MAPAIDHDRHVLYTIVDTNKGDAIVSVDLNAVAIINHAILPDCDVDQWCYTNLGWVE